MIWVQRDNDLDPLDAQPQIAVQVGSQLTWESDGSCEYLGPYLNQGGQDTPFGFIGPATPTELRHMVLYVRWGTETDPDTANLAKPLPLLLPGRALPGIANCSNNEKEKIMTATNREDNGTQQPRDTRSKGHKAADAGLSIAYGVLWTLVALIGVAGIFIAQVRWYGVILAVGAGWFAWRNFSRMLSP